MVDLWADEECLFNSSSPHYKDKLKRHNATERIRTFMEAEESPTPTVSDINSKMNSIKVYYSAIKGKRESALKSGKGADEIPPIKWPYFKLLSFLNDSITPRKPLTSFDLENQPVSIDDLTHTYSSTSKRKKSKKNDENTVAGERELLYTACALMKTPMNDKKRDDNATPRKTKNVDTDMDTDEIFCKMLTNQLRKVSEGREKEQLKMDLQKAIFNVIYPPEIPLQQRSTESNYSSPSLQQFGNPSRLQHVMNSPVYNVPMVPAQSSMTQQTQHRYATSIRRLSDGSNFQTPCCFSRLYIYYGTTTTYSATKHNI